MFMHYYALVLLPLFGFLIAGLGGCWLGHRGAQFITVFAVCASAALSVYLIQPVILGGNTVSLPLFDWIHVGNFSVNWGLRFDTLSVVMMNVITIVSACVHIYSLGYMHDDASRGRFFAYLNLFTFAMLMLVAAPNLLQLFFGWEGVGVASYLLIGFYNTKDSANAAAIKAFVVNRVGDFGLALGIMACFALFGTIQFDSIFAQVPVLKDSMMQIGHYSVHGFTFVTLLLLMGAVGKSAQLGLHTWLPDAMEGPTPVSALIHAATMVTAGVFLIARMSPVFEFAPFTLQLVTVIGALTAIIAATIGMVQSDIKRIIAFSTMSQLGYMFFALGVSAYSAAMFHLVTHAFFKALLFLSAGSVIHGLHHEQDIHKMGGIWKKMPVTYAFMWIGSLALAGIPFFAGYYSKDMILESAFAANSSFGYFAYACGIAAAFLTAFYSWRLIIVAFHGKTRLDHHTFDHAHEVPALMLAPKILLALGALGAGALLYTPFVGTVAHHETPAVTQSVVIEGHNATETVATDHQSAEPLNRDRFWGKSLFVLPENDSVTHAHHVPAWVKFLPLIMGVSGIMLAYLFYMFVRYIPLWLKGRFSVVHAFLYDRWMFDRLYDVLFVKDARFLGMFFSKKGDQQIIDGLGPDGFAKCSRTFSYVLRRIQSGFIYHYAFMMVLGVFAIFSYTLWKLMPH